MKFTKKRGTLVRIFMSKRTAATLPTIVAFMMLINAFQPFVQGLGLIASPVNVQTQNQGTVGIQNAQTAVAQTCNQNPNNFQVTSCTVNPQIPNGILGTANVFGDVFYGFYYFGLMLVGVVLPAVFMVGYGSPLALAAGYNLIYWFILAGFTYTWWTGRYQTDIS